VVPTLIYAPPVNYNGTDSFTFRVNDGQVNSELAVVNIDILPVNDAPVANLQSVATAEDTPLDILLTGLDPDGDPLTFTVVSSTISGTLSGVAPNLIYTPASNYNGADSFTFRVNDGQVDSELAVVNIDILPVNDAPVANLQSVATAEDIPLDILLTGLDPDGDPLTFTIVSSPTHGTLSGVAPDLTYTPATNYNGTDSFTFRVNDGQVSTEPAVVSIDVTTVNDAPVAIPQSVSMTEDTPLDIVLTGLDPDGDPLTFSVVLGPTHGILSGVAPDLTYTPATNYNGADSFTFLVNDGQVNSEPVLVSIGVTLVYHVLYVPLIFR
jgi:hypothetical protein